MSDERMTPAEVESVLARIETDLALLNERYDGIEARASQFVADAKRAGAPETADTVAEVILWLIGERSRLRRHVSDLQDTVPEGATIHVPTAWQVDAERVGTEGDANAEIAADTPGAALYADYRHLVGRHGFQSPPWDKTGNWEREWWEGLAGQHCNDSELNELLSRAYERARDQRQLIGCQRDMIDRLLAAARNERDDAVRKLADANAEHQRQLKIVFAERNEAQNNVRTGQARIGELERDRDELRATLREQAERDLEAMPPPHGDVKPTAPPSTWQPFQKEIEARDKRIAELESQLAEAKNEANLQIRGLEGDVRRYKQSTDDRDSEIAALKELRQRRENELAEVKATLHSRDVALGHRVRDLDDTEALLEKAEAERDEALARVRELNARAKDRRKELLGRISNAG